MENLIQENTELLATKLVRISVLFEAEVVDLSGSGDNRSQILSL